MVCWRFLLLFILLSIATDVTSVFYMSPHSHRLKIEPSFKHSIKGRNGRKVQGKTWCVTKLTLTSHHLVTLKSKELAVQSKQLSCLFYRYMWKEITSLLKTGHCIAPYSQGMINLIWKATISFSSSYLVLLIDLFLKFYVFDYLSAWKFVHHMCAVTKEARRGYRIPRTGGIDRCELQKWWLGNASGSSGRSASELNLWANSPALYHSYNEQILSFKFCTVQCLT